MKYEPWNWSLGGVTLELRHQDLLEAPERAWVNSENSAFEMAPSPFTVSGKLNKRFPFVQEELYAQTRMEILPPGTTLRTNGPSGKTIFHAGFHHPYDWNLGSDDRIAKHAAMIQRCIEDILECVVTEKISTVAFPMLGTGSFGLPISVFAQIFFESIAIFSRRVTTSVNVVLCVMQPEVIEEVVRFGTQALGALVGGGRPLLRDAGGHPIVRSLRHTARSLSDEKLQERNLLHFAEIALMTDMAVFYDLLEVSPSVLLEAGNRSECNLTFGIVRNRLESLRIAHDFPDWARMRYAAITRPSSRDAIGRLVKDRNDYAHNRGPRMVDSIVSDIEHVFGPEALPCVWEDVEPIRWIRWFDDGYGLLDGVDTTRARCSWLIPHIRQRVFGDLLPDSN